jgi:hypothetical protein
MSNGERERWASTSGIPCEDHLSGPLLSVNIPGELKMAVPKLKCFGESPIVIFDYRRDGHDTIRVSGDIEKSSTVDQVDFPFHLHKIIFQFKRFCHHHVFMLDGDIQCPNLIKSSYKGNIPGSVQQVHPAFKSEFSWKIFQGDEWMVVSKER